MAKLAEAQPTAGAAVPLASAEPDVLVMTATPIPRTLALTLYGDLDLSVLDELPPGRTPIVTQLRFAIASPKVWDFVRKQVAAGHQAYVVYPVIEENEETELKAAIKMYRELSGSIFPDLKVGLLHGRLDAELKDQVMRMFQKGELHILVATTVIEVGVDVPNATVMVIEHAERFGLAQLHQLRGRIGRGAAKSFCVLMTGGKVSEEGQRRLDAMVRTNDGFQDRRTRSGTARPGRILRHSAGWPAEFPRGEHHPRRAIAGGRQARGCVRAGRSRTPRSLRTKSAARWCICGARWQHTYGLVEVG